MSQTTSSAPLVRTTLFALLAAANVSPIGVTWSHPGSYRVIDNIYMGRVLHARSTIPVMRAGRKKREEEYLVEVHFECFRGGDDGSAAETQAFVLLATLEDMLANDPQIGLGSTEPTLRLHLDGWELKTDFDLARDGWGCKLSATVQVETRLG